MHGLERWNALPPAEAERDLRACNASPVWAREVAAARPLRDVAAVIAASDRALAGLDWSQIRVAIDAHPRIGDRIGGNGGREAAWSRREQAGAQDLAPATAAALVEANQQYEERFGHVFLIFATGLTADEMVAAARARLRNEESTERSVVRAELTKITGLRLERMFKAVPLSTHVLDTSRGEPASGVPVALYRGEGEVWVHVADGRTDGDGRLRDWVPSGAWAAGRYRLVFDTEEYLGEGAFFPEAAVTFHVTAPDRHHHVPLLLSPFGFTTYRGS
jgi:hydroxyisourate hydrolase